MRAHIDAELISRLRGRVVAHNDSGRPPVKLGELKKVYERGYRGSKPAVRAMEKVDAYLLAKAEEFNDADHPRGKAGEFASKGNVSFPTAKTETEHRQMQSANPTYRAMTSDVIPEHRGEALGGFARTAGSLLAGTALVAGLARGRPNGATAQALKWGVGKVGRYVAAAPTATASYGATAAALAARRSFAVRTGRVMPSSAYKTAAAVTNVAAKAGERVGRVVAHGGFRAASGIVRATMDAAGGGSSTARARSFFATAKADAKKAGASALASKEATKASIRADRAGSMARKAGAFSALALGTGAAINASIKDTSVDPAGYGRSYDALSYRTVAKSDAWGEARDRMTKHLRKGMQGGELQKAGFWSAASRVALPALAGIGGAALSGGAASFGQHHAGNPYRDKDGHFASKENAVNAASALVGVALAAGGVALALRSHNSKLFTQSVVRIGKALGKQVSGLHIDKLNRALTSRSFPEASLHPELVRQIKGRDVAVKHFMDTVKKGPIGDFRAHLDGIEKHGPSSTFNYQEAVRKAVNNKIADAAMSHDAFKVPYKGASTTIAELRANLKPSQVHDHVVSAVDGMTESGMKTATADLHPSVASLLQNAHAERGAKMAEVGQKLADHRNATEQAFESLQRLRTARDVAASVHVAADANLKVADDATKPAAQQIFETTKAALASAEEAHKTAGETLAGLQRNGPTISLSDGSAVKPPSVADVAATTKRLQAAALEHADSLAVAQIHDVRKAMVNERVTRADNRVLAMARAGGLGVIPEHAQEAAAEAIKHSAAHGMQKKIVDDLQMQLDLLPADKKAEKASLLAGLKADKAKLSTHQVALNKSTAALRSALENPPKARTVFDEHDTWLSPLVRDMKRVYRASSKPVKDILSNPTAQSLYDFAAAVPSHFSDTISHAASGAKAFYQGSLMTDAGGGKMVYSASKIATAIPVIGVAARAAYDLLGDAQALKDNIERSGLIEGVRNSSIKAVSIDKKIDPVTGEGHVTLTVPDSGNKNERIVLWGERNHLSNNRLQTSPLHAGARLSDVKQRLQEIRSNQNQGGNASANPGTGLRDAQNLNGEFAKKINGALEKLKSGNKLKTAPAGEETVTFRDHTAADHKEAVDAFKNHLNQALGRGVSSGLEQVFSKQGQVLTNREAYSSLTGHNFDGKKTGRKAVFNNEDFGTNDNQSIVEAMSSEIGKEKKNLESNPRLRSMMHKAVGVLHSVRKFSDEEVKSLHEQIKGVSLEPTKTEPAPEPIDTSHATDPSGEPDVEAIRAHISKHVPALADYLKVPSRERGTFNDAMTGLTYHTARRASEMGHSFGPATAYKVTHDVIKSFVGEGGDDEDKTLALHEVMINSDNWDDPIDQGIDNAVKRGGVHKAVVLDDIDLLMKLSMAPFEESLHPRAPDGEFSDGQGHGQRLAREAGDTAIEGGQKVNRATAPTPQPWSEPLRLGRELGASLGNEGGYLTASALTSKIVGAIAPKGVTSAAALAAGLIGSSWAGEKLGNAGEAAGRGVHHLLGQQAPKQAIAPEYHSLGEMGAEAAGGFAGQVVGSGIGAGVGGALGTLVAPGVGTTIGAFGGRIAGGALGNYFGSIANRGIFNHFAGYDSQAVDRISAKFNTKIPPVNEALSRDRGASRAIPR